MSNRINFSQGTTAIFVIILLFLTVGCNEGKDSASLLSDTMMEINKKGNGCDNFRAYNETDWFTIIYELENTPENKAKILWMVNHEDLESKFRNEMLNNLKKGNILDRLIKEGKSLILIVSADKIEYHAVFSPREISQKVLNK